MPFIFIVPVWLLIVLAAAPLLFVRKLRFLAVHIVRIQPDHHGLDAERLHLLDASLLSRRERKPRKLLLAK